MKKLIVTMCIGNWEPEITSQTFALMNFHALKIGADFKIIDERKSPTLPMCYERFQIYDMVDDYDWIIQLDADLLMHPDMPDVTEIITKDTILISTWDWLTKRFKPDNYFRRDGRHISVPGFFTVTSNWMKDFWRVPDDSTIEECITRCTPVLHEFAGRQLGSDHIVLDYIFSRNVARYGLKVRSLQELFQTCSSGGRMPLNGIEEYIMHNSYLPLHQKKQHIEQVLNKHWKIDPKGWNIK
jgi:hypothetical protein